MHNIDRRALEALRHILTTDFSCQRDDYSLSYNGLVSFDDKPVVPRIEGDLLRMMGYDREPQ